MPAGAAHSPFMVSTRRCSPIVTDQSRPETRVPRSISENATVRSNTSAGTAGHGTATAHVTATPPLSLTTVDHSSPASTPRRSSSPRAIDAASAASGTSTGGATDGPFTTAPGEVGVPAEPPATPGAPDEY